MRSFAVFMSIFIVVPIWAKCVIPVPDGAGINPSKRSLAGEVVFAQGMVIYILNVDSDSIVRLDLNERLIIYTAFGGGDSVDILRNGLSAKVWLSGCQKPKNSNDEIEYFEIFSTDPTDKPDFEYLKE